MNLAHSRFAKAHCTSCSADSAALSACHASGDLPSIDHEGLSRDVGRLVRCEKGEQGRHVRPWSSDRSTPSAVPTYHDAPTAPGSKKNEMTRRSMPIACVQVLPSSSLRNVPLAELTSRTFPVGSIPSDVPCGVA